MVRMFLTSNVKDALIVAASKISRKPTATDTAMLATEAIISAPLASDMLSATWRTIGPETHVKHNIDCVINE